MTPKSVSLRRYLTDQCGAIAVEFALTAPIMAMMIFGIFEVGMVVARQTELQSAATEIESIVLATNRGAETSTDQLEEILMASVDLTADNVSITRKYRCGISSQLVDDDSMCSEHEVISDYLKVDISDSHLPTWTSFGVGREIDLSVERMVQIS